MDMDVTPLKTVTMVTMRNVKGYLLPTSEKCYYGNRMLFMKYMC